MKSAWRKTAYEASASFREALVVVQHDLRLAAKAYPNEVIGFLSWVRTDGSTLSTVQIRKKIKGFDGKLSASLRLYVGFVLRFCVYLKDVRRAGALDFSPDYRDPLHSQMMVKVAQGKLIPPRADPDADVQDSFASVGGIPAQIRRGVKRKGSHILMSEERKLEDAELLKSKFSESQLDHFRKVQRNRGSNPEDAKLRIVEVDSKDSSAVTQLLDLSYDPLSVTFFLVSSRRQSRLMCLVGELVSDDDWNRLGVVRAILHRITRGRSPAGAPMDFLQFAQDVKHIPLDGIISKDCVTTAMGEAGSNAKFTTTQRRLLRTKACLDRVRQQISI